MDIDYRNLGKTVCHALRHEPEKYGLELDEYGYVQVEKLLYALRNYKKKWNSLTLQDIHRLVETDSKKRYILNGNMICAAYGHSVPIKIKKEEKIPPEILYHGTAPKLYNIIMNEGLKSMSRQYVHLSEDPKTAYTVGKRHSNESEPIIFSVAAKKAYDDGIKFYYGNDTTWLADYIPSKYLSFFQYNKSEE